MDVSERIDNGEFKVLILVCNRRVDVTTREVVLLFGLLSVGDTQLEFGCISLVVFLLRGECVGAVKHLGGHRRTMLVGVRQCHLIFLGQEPSDHVRLTAIVNVALSGIAILPAVGQIDVTLEILVEGQCVRLV